MKQFKETDSKNDRSRAIKRGRLEKLEVHDDRQTKKPEQPKLLRSKARTFGGLITHPRRLCLQMKAPAASPATTEVHSEDRRSGTEEYGAVSED